MSKIASRRASLILQLHFNQPGEPSFMIINQIFFNIFLSCHEVKVKLDPSVKIGQCLNIWYFCRQVSRCDNDCWKAALGRALVIVKQVGKICTPGKIVIELCVGLVDGHTHSRKALDIPDSQLYLVSYVFFCVKNLIYNDFMYNF